jgi:threonine dehydrogenase-like Zn-dependent dehydrogenase
MMADKKGLMHARIEAGSEWNGRPTEWAARMKALVYFGRGRAEVVPDRPVWCTPTDVVARVDRVYRCGTDVKVFLQGRPDPLDEALIGELRELFELRGDGRPENLRAYADLLLDGRADREVDDELYRALAAHRQGLSDEEAEAMREAARHYWGRILGHESVMTIEHVGSQVGTLTEGIGYCEGETLSADYLTFRPGERIVVQSRTAKYQRPTGRWDHPGAKGLQLLGEDLYGLQWYDDAAYAQYVRLDRAITRSGSILRVPDGVDDATAAMVEPAACLLDCFEKSAHEIGQDDRGTILKKGVMPGGTVLVIGSGVLALLSVRYALMDDPLIEIGGAARVVVTVRSPAKRDLVKGFFPDQRVTCLIADTNEALAQLPAQIADFQGFDDIVLAAGDGQTLAVAHQLLVPTGGRILAFAGTRGVVDVDSAVWHYGAAGTVGSSGCNTKAMENVLALVERGSVRLGDLAGKTYSLTDIEREGAEPFFTDRHLRPALCAWD